MIRVYIVEDNTPLLKERITFLKSQGIDCYGAANSKELNTLMVTNLPDIVVLEWKSSGEDGLLIAQQLRINNQTKHIGIVLLTTRGRVDDCIIGLEFADSYHIKPIGHRELSAVITSISRRIIPKNSPDAQPIWQLYAQSLELHSPTGHCLTLSYREYVTLRRLAQSPNTAVHVKHIIEIWEKNWINFERNRVELLLSRLRSKIKVISNNKSNPICSIRNFGYQLTISIEILK